MKNIKVSEELYEKLKSFVADPFDDTPDAVLSRVIDIADKARHRWNGWDDEVDIQVPRDKDKVREEVAEAVKVL